MNPKAIIMLCLILFAYASVITTMTVAFGGQKPDVSTTTETAAFTVNSNVEPAGDEVDNPVVAS